MGLESIITKVKKDTNKVLGDISRETSDQLKAINSDTGREEDLLKKNFARKTDNSVQELRNRRLSDSRVTMKKEMLDSQSRIIDEVFEKSKESFLELPEKKYFDYLRKKIMELNISGSWELVLNEKDKKRFGPELIEKISNHAKSRFRLILSETSRKISGGFILKGEDTELNASLDVLLSQIRREMEPGLGKLLFGK
jgi:V/A-type H+-transporting ATPase subunit E